MQSYMTLYGRTFDLRVKSKYIGFNNRNKDHLPQLPLVCVCLYAVWGPLEVIWGNYGFQYIFFVTVFYSFKIKVNDKSKKGSAL